MIFSCCIDTLRFAERFLLTKLTVSWLNQLDYFTGAQHVNIPISYWCWLRVYEQSFLRRTLAIERVTPLFLWTRLKLPTNVLMPARKIYFINSGCVLLFIFSKSILCISP